MITEFMSKNYGLAMRQRCKALSSGTIVQMCIITGPNIDIAIKLIKRMKGIFEKKLGLVFQNKETVLGVEWLHDRSVSF